MSGLEPPDWLRVVKCPSGTTLQHGRCLSDIKEQLVSPQAQFPSLTLFIGQRRKDVAIRQLFPENQVSPAHSCVQLHVDNRTVFTENPFLFAHCNQDMTVMERNTAGSNWEETFLPWASPVDRVWDTILARALCMFVDVICIFADDLGGLDAVHAWLTKWAIVARNASNLDYRPRVLIVTSMNSRSITQDFLEETDFLFMLTQDRNISEVFRAPGFLRLAGAPLSDMAQHRPLKDELWKTVDMNRRDRRLDGYLFSAVHLDLFFRRALSHVCRASESPFLIIQSSRKEVIGDQQHASHLRHFLTITNEENWKWEGQAAFVASTLMVDAYPVGSYYFSPAAIFDSLYRQACQEAVTSTGFLSTQVQLVEFYLAQFYDRLLFGQGPPRRIHQENLAGWKIPLKTLVTTHTCLACLERSPQHPLSCGHAYCDVCAAWYGRPLEGAEYRYWVDRCVLCQEVCVCDNIINLLPPTAAVRAISIDGGGVRGFIPLRFLLHIQDALGPECPVQDLVDVAFGSSAGGIAVLEAFHQRRPIKECEYRLTNLMTRFFKLHPAPLSAWARIIRTIRCWWADGWYSASVWEELLQQEFSKTTAMFDVQPVSGTKVAVITIADRPVLLVNYRRAVEIQNNEGSYYVHEATDKFQEPKLWQCARATSAVPVNNRLFPPIELPGVGACEDGGLQHNNPAAVCRAETQFMWIRRPVPETLISFGTGKSVGRRRRRLWARGFASRLYHSFMASMDAEQAWNELLGQLDETSKRCYHRLDVTFPGEAPLMNSAAEVEWMANLVDQVASAQVPSALDSLLLSSLFFELSAAPRWEGNRFHCIGVIRCRLRGTILVDVLSRLHPRATTFILDSARLGISPFDGATCDCCLRYCVPIRFWTEGLDNCITISLELEPNKIHPLGGFPLSLRWLLTRQSLELFDGSANSSGLPARAECKSCDMRIHRKCMLTPQTRSYRKRVRFI
ncbi:FabD/lysophospholipase-like protein [Aspergillus leporis]|uniref:FabD/lysophospholipase-like protein n=1 Tax=Aspergillus leporis TaxID=41062 RepID=A0A5N5WI75_9EURO|nr:FabD/lysophospholipase-like protein [Aspergillus leporis]